MVLMHISDLGPSCHVIVVYILFRSPSQALWSGVLYIDLTVLCLNGDGKGLKVHNCIWSNDLHPRDYHQTPSTLLRGLRKPEPRKIPSEADFDCINFGLQETGLTSMVDTPIYALWLRLYFRRGYSGRRPGHIIKLKQMQQAENPRIHESTFPNYELTLSPCNP